jgi:hypothetical protein
MNYFEVARIVTAAVQNDKSGTTEVGVIPGLQASENKARS